MKRSAQGLAVLIVMGLGVTCLAGFVTRYKCSTRTCGFEGTLDVGGWMRGSEVSGYCTTCKKFVQITWGQKDPKPEPHGSIWIPGESAQRKLYQCPDCKGLFAELGPTSWVGLTQEPSYCPKCTHRTFTVQQTGQSD